MEMRDGWVTNGDVRLRWEHWRAPGAETPLLLVNGLSSPMVGYDEGFIVELGERGFDVVRFDNRDAGRSTSTSGGYRLSDMAADAVAVLDTVGWDTAHAFGMSMGGMIVQQLGIDHAHRLRSITSVMSTTGNPQYGTPSKAAMAALMTPAPTEREAWLDHRVSSEEIWASPAAWDPAAARRRGERLFDYGMQPTQVQHQYAAVMASGSREEALAGVTTPTLVLHGTEDTLIHVSGGRRTAEVMPNATLVELEGMGHDIPPSYWHTIADHLRAFVDGLS